MKEKGVGGRKGGEWKWWAEVHSIFIIRDLSGSSINEWKENSGNIILNIGYSGLSNIGMILGFLSCLQSEYIKRVIYRQTNRFARLDSMRFNRVLLFVRRCSCESRDLGLFLSCQKTVLLIAYQKEAIKFLNMPKWYYQQIDKMIVLLFYVRVM